MAPAGRGSHPEPVRQFHIRCGSGRIRLPDPPDPAKYRALLPITGIASRVSIRVPGIIKEQATCVEPLQVHPTVLISIAGKCAQNIFADLWKVGELIDRQFHHVSLQHSGPIPTLLFLLYHTRARTRVVELKGAVALDRRHLWAAALQRAGPATPQEPHAIPGGGG